MGSATDPGGFGASPTDLAAAAAVAAALAAAEAKATVLSAVALRLQCLHLPWQSRGPPNVAGGSEKKAAAPPNTLSVSIV